MRRVDRFVTDLPMRWTGQRVLVIGHAATHWAVLPSGRVL